MKKKGCNIILKYAVLAFAVSCFSCSNKPNLLFIITDDQGYGDLSLHGNTILNTPNMDAIGMNGVRLDNFHVSPVCAPTRAAILTGRRPLSTGAYYVTRGGEIMDSAEYTLAEVFKDNGYATGCFGKWHNGAHHPYHPVSQGFDDFFGFTAGHWNRYFDPELEDNGCMVQTHGYIADVLTERAIRFMHENKNDPFFCYLSYNTPHSPFQVPDEYFEQYIDLVAEEDTAMHIMNAAVYGMIKNIDDNIGRLMKNLADLDLEENTIVIFTSDNGPNTRRYNSHMKGRKAWVNDGGVRVPFFIQWKNRLPGNRIITSTTAHIDILPTLVSLMGLDFTERKTIHGMDLSGLLTGKQDQEMDRILFTHVNPGLEPVALPGAVRTRDWRLVLNADGRKELTNRSDARELHNLADSLPFIADSLEQIYLDWFQPFDSLKIPPIPVGNADSVNIPAHEGFLSGTAGYRWSVNGWSNDWVTRLDTSDSFIYWPLYVHHGDSYTCVVRYTLVGGEAGIRIRINGKTLERMVDPFKPTPDLNYSRIDRPAEAIGQTWARTELGSIQLERGSCTLQLYASSRDVEILEVILIRKHLGENL